MSIVFPEWPVPQGVHLAWTQRHGGVSAKPFDSFNLAHHVGDEPAAVDANRAQLLTHLPGCNDIRWLSQVHGTDVKDVCLSANGEPADAAFSTEPGLAACVMTADCLPVFFWQADGRQVAIAHAGWRGLAGGVLAQTLAQFDDPANVFCGIGPAIGPTAFEVGADVVEAFINWPNAKLAFMPTAKAGKWLADLPALAAARLQYAGVAAVYHSNDCTFVQADDFYSYRRDGRTGRMANLIWIAADD
ncbi:peptidoglycan editing factor PgeF [Saccharospirillum mangrovi]|uniref:peptidoglycan editing factor PgeF n=1 Tax=Saccharospirillum mangrovi TaxID=2161747 RepID=UPI000D38B69D|nr:peptidoglycan editing factor PgeF [Saccharospirillum mangrovi]